jgi:hypothetical protein
MKFIYGLLCAPVINTLLVGVVKLLRPGGQIRQLSFVAEDRIPSLLQGIAQGA